MCSMVIDREQRCKRWRILYRIPRVNPHLPGHREPERPRQPVHELPTQQGIGMRGERASSDLDQRDRIWIDPRALDRGPPLPERTRARRPADPRRRDEERLAEY